MSWYTQFFHGLTQEAWRAAQSEETTQLEVDFLFDLLDLQPSQRVLDIFCGYGRHALELARLGCTVTGVDISADYTREFQASAQQLALPVEVITGDFLYLPLENGFDAAYCFGNSFSFFPHDQMLVFLQKTAALLPPGGLFVADTGMIAESVLPDFQERSWMEVGPITVLIENEYDARYSRIDSYVQYLQYGEDRTVVATESRTASHYLFTMAELYRLFEQAGLTITETFSSLDGTEFILGDERLLLLAQKN